MMKRKLGLPDPRQRGVPCELGPLSPSGSRSSFTAHQTWLCLLDTGALDQTCIVILFFFSHQVELFERKDRTTGAY